VTIVRTEFGKTIAGFTHYPWTSDKTNGKYGNFVDDAEKRTFLLSLDLKEKMVPVTANNLIYCSKTVGPTFGEGDLEICHECNIIKKSSTNFPSRYNAEGPLKYSKGQNSLRALSGVTHGDKFFVLEYEVYRVVYDEPWCECLIF
jgi:hypothetical protein